MKVIAKRKRRKPWKQATNLTRKYYEAKGFHIAYVERVIKRKIPGTPWRKTLTFDAFGFADFFAFKIGRPGFVGINSCKGMHELRLHVEKFRLLSSAHDFLVHDSNNRIVVFAWDRPRERGLRIRMKCRQLRLADFEPRVGDACEITPRLKKGKRNARSDSTGTDAGRTMRDVRQSDGTQGFETPSLFDGFRERRRPRVGAGPAA